MSLFRSIAAAALKELSGPPHAGGSSAWGSRYPYTALPRERSYGALVTDPMMNNIVAACVLWICRNYPKAPIMLTDKRADKRVTSHPFLALQRRPNPSYSGVTMDWALLLSFITDGNAYKLKRRSGADRHVESWYVPHWTMEPKWPNDGQTYISHYAYAPGDGKVYRVETKDVVHRRYGLDPSNTRKGLSPLKSLLREIYTDEEAARFSAALLHNMGLPGMIVSPKVSVDPADADAVKAKLEQEFGGDKRGGFMVPHGPTDVTVVGFNPEQLDLGRLREIPEERVAAVIGVPAAVVGFGTGMQQTKVGATMRELRGMAWEDGIMPLHLIMAPEIERDELTEFVDTLDAWEVGFDYEPVPELGENNSDKAARVLDGVRSGAATVADWREVAGLDVRPQDALFLRPFQAIEVPDGGNGRDMTVVMQAGAPAGASLSDHRADLKLLTGGRKATAADARYLRALDTIVRRMSAAMSEEVEVKLDALGRMAERAYVATSGGKAVQLDPDDESIVVRVLASLGLTDWAERELAPIFRRYSGLVAEATYGAVSQRVGIDVAWDIDDPVAVALIESGGTRAGLVDIPAQTRDALRRAIAAGRDAGDNPITIARRIRDDVPAGPFPGAGAKYRAELIARTEALHAQRVSTLKAGEAMGIAEYVVFDARLGDTDADCEVLDQSIVTLEQAEELMGSEHPNGTRSFSPLPRTGRSERYDMAAVKLATDRLTGTDPFRCSGCKRLLAEAAGLGTRIKCRCGIVNEQLGLAEPVSARKGAVTFDIPDPAPLDVKGIAVAFREAVATMPAPIVNVEAPAPPAPRTTRKTIERDSLGNILAVVETSDDGS